VKRPEPRAAAVLGMLAILGGISYPLFADDDLGRLFHSPAERTALDAARSSTPPPASSPKAPEALPAAVQRETPPAEQNTPAKGRRTGVVTRAGRPIVEWFDGSGPSAPSQP
jgi:hypothetical protein